MIALLLAALMVLSLAACGAKGETGRDRKQRPDTAQERRGSCRHAQGPDGVGKTTILSENTALWEKVFLAADKGMTMQEDGKNYGDFLLDTIESAKDQFTADELKLIRGEAEKIRDIESKLTMIEKKYPEAAQESLDGAMSVPADGSMNISGDTSMLPDNGSMQKFPSFEGKDLDGNDVTSDELFSSSAVTVVNFWFTTCSPCVGELGELDALNKELAEEGRRTHRRQRLHIGWRRSGDF